MGAEPTTEVAAEYRLTVVTELLASTLSRRYSLISSAVTSYESALTSDEPSVNAIHPDGEGVDLPELVQRYQLYS